MEKIYWILLNFPDDLLTSCTSIEQVKPTFQSHRKNVLYQHRDSNVPNTHIMSLSWIMDDGRMEYMYWLLINFPDNLLTSWSSIEQVNLPSSHNGKIYYINSGILTFLTHILCDSSWIRGEGRMNVIYHFLWTFQIICLWITLLLSRSTSLEVG
jgi:hypothetical protein